jgi:hypothetical protein
MVLETSVLYMHLRRLIAPENFTEVKVFALWYVVLGLVGAVLD